LEEPAMKAAIKRIIDDEVFPKSVLIPEESWEKAVKVRVEAGDLKTAAKRTDGCDLGIMEEATK
jgi:hypothetical protein